jgi:hypothetical protein
MHHFWALHPIAVATTAEKSSASAPLYRLPLQLSHQVVGHQIALQPFSHSVIAPGNHLVIHRLLVMNLYEIIPNEFHRIFRFNENL